ncbi:hypothetical protein [Hydrogenophaga sp. 5NK40-0174]|uniref:hypothetical protein n=1 Tax=Hydrogenophaga sp. 5NK40-0174 TaxID=3127649 RepID=UPI003106E494
MTRIQKAGHHIAIGVAAVAAASLLSAFTGVVQAQRERGDLRLAQQARTGQWLLPDERGNSDAQQAQAVAQVSLSPF